MLYTRNILKAFFLLLVSILLTGYDLLKKIVLPGRNRKGNLLGSVFVLFIEIVEKIIAFEKEIFHSAWLIKNRFVKQGLIIVTIFLFLVSSFEWTNPGDYSRTSDQEEMAPAIKTEATVANVLFSKKATKKVTAEETTQSYPFVFSSPIDIAYHPPALKRFLLFSVIRV